VPNARTKWDARCSGKLRRVTDHGFDVDAANLFAFRVWNYKQGELVSVLIHLGDRLGLYRALDGRGPTTAAELADATGLHPRWLLEWLRGNAAADLLESTDGEQFELTREGAAVLAHEEHSLLFAAGAFTARSRTDSSSSWTFAFASLWSVSSRASW